MANFYSIKDFANLIRKQEPEHNESDDDWAVADYIARNPTTKSYIDQASLDSVVTKWGKDSGLDEILKATPEVITEEEPVATDTKTTEEPKDDRGFFGKIFKPSPEEMEERKGEAVERKERIESELADATPGQKEAVTQATSANITGMGEATVEDIGIPKAPPLNILAKSLAMGTANTVASPIQKMGQFFREERNKALHNIVPKENWPRYVDYQASPWAYHVASQELRNQAKYNFEELTVKEQEAALDKNVVETFASSIREMIPEEWEEEVSKYEIDADDLEQSGQAIAVGTAQTLPLVATQWGLSTIPVVGQPMALGSMMMIEGGSMLNMADQVGEGLREKIMASDGGRPLTEDETKMINEFRHKVEQMSSLYGILSGTVEYSGNLLGHMGGMSKLLTKIGGKMGKHPLGKVARELAGFVTEGGEELAQFTLQEQFMKLAIKSVAEKHGRKDFEELWDDKSGWKEFVMGAGVSAILRGGRAVPSQIRRFRKTASEQIDEIPNLNEEEMADLKDAAKLIEEDKASELTDEQRKLLAENQLTFFSDNAFEPGQNETIETKESIREEIEALNKEVADRGLVGKPSKDLTDSEYALIKRVQDVQNKLSEMEGAQLGSINQAEETKNQEIQGAQSELDALNKQYDEMGIEGKDNLSLTPEEFGVVKGIQQAEAKLKELSPESKLTPVEPQQATMFPEPVAKAIGVTGQETTSADKIEGALPDVDTENMDDKQLTTAVQAVESDGGKIVDEVNVSPTLGQLKDDFLESSSNIEGMSKEDQQGIIEEAGALKKIFLEENPDKTEADFSSWLTEEKSTQGQDFTPVASEQVGDVTVEIVSKEGTTKTGKKKKVWEVHHVDKNGKRTVKVRTPVKKVATTLLNETKELGVVEETAPAKSETQEQASTIIEEALGKKEVVAPEKKAETPTKTIAEPSQEGAPSQTYNEKEVPQKAMEAIVVLDKRSADYAERAKTQKGGKLNAGQKAGIKSKYDEATAELSKAGFSEEEITELITNADSHIQLPDITTFGKGAKGSKKRGSRGKKKKTSTVVGLVNKILKPKGEKKKEKAKKTIQKATGKKTEKAEKVEGDVTYNDKPISNKNTKLLGLYQTSVEKYNKKSGGNLSEGQQQGLKVREDNLQKGLQAEGFTTEEASELINGNALNIEPGKVTKKTKRSKIADVLSSKKKTKKEKAKAKIQKVVPPKAEKEKGETKELSERGKYLTSGKVGSRPSYFMGSVVGENRRTEGELNKMTKAEVQEFAKEVLGTELSEQTKTSMVKKVLTEQERLDFVESGAKAPKSVPPTQAPKRSAKKNKVNQRRAKAKATIQENLEKETAPAKKKRAPAKKKTAPKKPKETLSEDEQSSLVANLVAKVEKSTGKKKEAKDKIQKVVAPEHKTTPSKPLTAIEKAKKMRADALARIKNRGADGIIEMKAGFNPLEAKDEIIVGASFIIEGAVHLKDFTAKMVQSFGKKIEPFIKELWKHSSNEVRLMEKAEEEANRKAIAEETPNEKLTYKKTSKPNSTHYTAKGKGRIDKIDYTVSFHGKGEKDERGNVTFALDGRKYTKSIGAVSEGKQALEAQIREKIEQTKQANAENLLKQVADDFNREVDEEPSGREDAYAGKRAQARKKIKQIIFPRKGRKPKKPSKQQEEWNNLSDEVKLEKLNSVLEVYEQKLDEVETEEEIEKVQSEIKALETEKAGIEEAMGQSAIFSKDLNPKVFQRKVDQAQKILQAQLKIRNTKEEQERTKGIIKAMTPLKSDSKEMLNARRNLVYAIIKNSQASKAKNRIGKSSGKIGTVKKGEYRELDPTKLVKAAHNAEINAVLAKQKMNDILTQIQTNNLKPKTKYRRPDRIDFSKWSEEDKQMILNINEAMDKVSEDKRAVLLEASNEIEEKYEVVQEDKVSLAEETQSPIKPKSEQDIIDEAEDAIDDSFDELPISDKPIEEIMGEKVDEAELTEEEIEKAQALMKVAKEVEEQDSVDMEDDYARKLTEGKKDQSGLTILEDYTYFDTKTNKIVNMKGTPIEIALTDAGFRHEGREIGSLKRTPTSQNVKKALSGFIFFNGELIPAVGDIITLTKNKIENQKAFVEEKRQAIREARAYNAKRNLSYGDKINLEARFDGAQRTLDALNDYLVRAETQNAKWNMIGKKIYTPPIQQNSEDYRRRTEYSSPRPKLTPRMFETEIEEVQDDLASQERELSRINKNTYITEEEKALRGSKIVARIATLRSREQALNAQFNFEKEGITDVEARKRDAVTNEQVFTALSPELQEGIEIRRAQMPPSEHGSIKFEGGKNVIRINSTLNAQEYRRALIHEIVGHYGATAVMNTNKVLKAQVDKLWEKNRDSAESIQILASAKDTDVFGGKTNPNMLNSEQERVLMEEWLASKLEGANLEIGSGKRGVGQKIKSALKNQLRKMGVGGSFLDSVVDDIVIEMGVTHDTRMELDLRYAMSDRANLAELKKTLRANYSPEQVTKLEIEMAKLIKERKGLKGDQLVTRAQINLELQKTKDFRKSVVQQLIFDYARQSRIEIDKNNAIPLRSLGFTGVDTAMKNATTLKDFRNAVNKMDSIIEKKGRRIIVKKVQDVMAREFNRIAKIKKGKGARKVDDQALVDYMSQFYYMSENKDQKLKESYDWFHENPNEDIPEQLLKDFPKVFGQNLNMMPSRELVEIYNAFKDKKKLQNLKNRLMKTQEARERQIEIDEAIKTLKSVSKTNESDPIDKAIDLERLMLQKEGSLGAKALDKTIGPAIKSGAKTTGKLLHGMWKPETIIKHLDGWKKGVIYKNVWKPMWEAHQKEQVAVESGKKKIKEIMLDNNIDFLNDDKKIFGEFTVESADGVQKTVPMTINNMMHIYGHKDNTESNRHLKATGVSEQTIKEVEEKLPDNYKKFVNDMKEYYDKEVYPRMNQVYKAKTGLDLPRVENYLPIHNVVSSNDQTKFYADILAQAGFGAITLDRSHTHERVKSDSAFGKLDFFGSIFSAFKTNEHWMAYEPVREGVSKFLGDKEYRDAQRGSDKAWAYNELNHWISAVMRGRVNTQEEDSNAINGVADKMRHMYMATALGGNVVTMLKQPASFAVGAAKIIENGNIWDIIKTAGRYSTLNGASESHKFINENSVLMRNRGKNMNFEFAEIAEANEFRDMFSEGSLLKSLSPSLIKKKFDANGMKGFGRYLRDVSMQGIRFFDRVTTETLWLSQYEQSMNKHGNHKLSVEQADEVIRTTQPMGDLIDINRLRRDKGMARTLTVFSEQLTQNYNIARETVGKAMAGEANMAQTANMGLMLGLVSPMLITMAAHGVAPGMDRWDSKKWLEYMFQNILGGIPFVNIGSDALVKYGTNLRREYTAEGKSKHFGYSNVATEFLTNSEKILEKGLTNASPMDYFQVASTVGLPGGVAVNRATKGISEWSENLESGPQGESGPLLQRLKEKGGKALRGIGGITHSKASLKDNSRKAHMGRIISAKTGDEQKRLTFIRGWYSMDTKEQDDFIDYLYQEHNISKPDKEVADFIKNFTDISVGDKTRALYKTLKEDIKAEEKKKYPSKTRIRKLEEKFEEDVENIEKTQEKREKALDKLEAKSSQ